MSSTLQSTNVSLEQTPRSEPPQALDRIKKLREQSSDIFGNLVLLWKTTRIVNLQKYDPDAI